MSDRSGGDGASLGASPDAPRPALSAVGAASRALPGDDRIATVPNAITLVRLLCLPVYLWLLLHTEDRMVAAGLLAGLGATDWADGYIARHFNQTSNLGRTLDPVADRMLFFVGVGGILAVDAAPRWFCIVVLVRESLVGGAAVLLAALGAERIEVTWFGKAGTFCLMFAFPLFLAGSSSSTWAPAFENLGWLAAIPGLALSIYAAVGYVPIGWRALRAGRASRAPDARAGRATG
ncbi:CDP-alcohol phosphatidyltransferase family protein [Rhabdothermincola sediminis]|uniref:CDP-alcohol phosphatidyltransferase family protein n=1 Tax=Rhabdothermincola sediminis TaxID=2751370 RepID=UPI001F1B4E5B|nr:CDP-alcohol phosphatidyltransferase family protein [Rhabdothermincola sediminis]